MTVTTMAAEELEVRQIFVDLLGNALELTDHGQVVVRVSDERDAAGRQLVVAASDTGLGIAAEREDRGPGDRGPGDRGAAT